MEDHFSKLIRLMEMEAEAEKQAALQEMQRRSPQQAEASGTSLIQLTLRDEESGLGGRVLWTLGKRNQTLPLPWTRLGVGAPVILSEERPARLGEPMGEGWRGVISHLNRETVQVAFNDLPEIENERPTFRLDRSTDEIARQRQRQALERARTAEDNRLAELRGALLGERPPLFSPLVDFQPLDGSLNAAQVEAVRHALEAQDVAIIHGPPGTGKTTTLVELIRQITGRGERVLACAPSNLGVDNLLEKLLAVGVSAIRLGHPARVLPELRQHTLEEMVAAHPDLKLAQKYARQARELRRQAGRYTRAKPLPGEKQALRQEAKSLLAEARCLEDQVVERLLGNTPVLCATTTGLDERVLGRQVFDWCVIDEAGQSTEPGSWTPLQYGRRLALAGDPFQLPPTVISVQAAAQGFDISMLERLMSSQPTIARRLEVQYRMHEDIMRFSSQEFYGGSQVADESVRRRRLCDLPGVQVMPLTESPLEYIDTAGASYDEEVDENGESRFNPQEAALALRKVQALLEAGVAGEQIAVITPYAAQARFLRQRLPQPEIEVDSVDGFQGREKEAVIVSLVRANPEGEIGFLEDVRRMNVALTRARRKLIVIGDSATITSHPFYQRFVAYCEQAGAYKSVWEVV